MSLKTKSPDKMFMEQFIINGASDLAKWSEDNLTILLKDNLILGYYFATKPSTSFGEDIEILNLYLINSRHYHNKEVVSLDELEDAWEQFKRCPHRIFNNPPIDVWLDSKDNWCNMLANKMSKKYNCSFEDALSNVYYIITKCYNKQDVYMGNLSYLNKAINNQFLLEYKYNKNRINQDSGMAISLSTVIHAGDTDEDKITLENLIAAPEDKSDTSLDYRDLVDSCIELLSDTFGPREIELIMTEKPMYLPRNVYVRLIKWRQKHSIRELYKSETE